MDLQLRPSRNSKEVRTAFESRMDRDLPSWRDILTDFTQDQGNNLIKFCIEYYDFFDDGPDGLVKPYASADCFILMAAYVKIGQIGLPDVETFYIGDCFELRKQNTEGRITKMTIDSEYINEDLDARSEDYEHYNLPGLITNLQYLENVKIANCGSIRDADLSLLPHLRKLTFEDCQFSLNSVQLKMKLPHLKRLNIYGCSDMSKCPVFLSWMISQLPVLEKIDFMMGPQDKIEPFIDALANNNICFQGSLNSIAFTHCDLSNNDTFKKLINSVLPKFPNLTYVGFTHETGSFNNDTFKKLINSVLPKFPNLTYVGFTHETGSFKYATKDREIGSFSGRLRWPLTFDLGYIHLNKINKVPTEIDPTEITALLKFLEINSNIINLGLSVYNRDEDYHPKVKYALLINHAGRAIVQHNSNNSNRSSSPIPPSILPKFLERAYVKSGDVYVASGSSYRPVVAKKDHTGVYYLLRQNIPALVLSSVTATNDGDVNAVPSSKKQKRDNDETNN